MGYLRGHTGGFGCDHLPPSENVLRDLQIWGIIPLARFLLMCHMAPDWCLEEVWVQVREGCFHDDMWVPIASILNFSLDQVPDNGTGAPAGWNWILSLCVT